MKLLIWSSYLSPLRPSPDRMWPRSNAWISLIWSILSLPHHPSPACTWILSIVWIHFFWSSYPLLFIHLQDVCELDQLFLNLSSNHPIPSSSSVSSSYVNSLNCLNISHLIILSLPLHLYPESTWTWSIVLEYFSSHQPFSSSSSVSREYVNLINCLNIAVLIILSLPLHPSQESTWTWTIVWIPLFWSSRPILLIRFQNVRDLRQLFGNPSSDHSIPSY